MTVLDFEEQRRRAYLARDMERERQRAERRRALVELGVILAVGVALIAVFAGAAMWGRG